MPNVKTITIGPYSFPITPGYAAGAFPIGPAELETLDYARAERVRKKGFKVFEKLRIRSGKRTLSEGELRHLTEAVAGMDRDVRLERQVGDQGAARSVAPKLGLVLGGEGGEAGEPGTFDQGAFDSELARLAELRLAAEETARGARLPSAAREAALGALRGDPNLRDAARARVEEVLEERGRIAAELF